MWKEWRFDCFLCVVPYEVVIALPNKAITHFGVMHLSRVGLVTISVFVASIILTIALAELIRELEITRIRH